MLLLLLLVQPGSYTMTGCLHSNIRLANMPGGGKHPYWESPGTNGFGLLVKPAACLSEVKEST